VQSVLKRRAAEPGEIEEIRLLVERYGGVEYALGCAHEYAGLAKEALGAFSEGPDKETLLLVADYVVERDT
jgi:geranylgeranyl pyrophosphate synthase